MIALPYFNYEVAPGGELRVIGGGSVGLECEKFRALGDAVVILISDGIVHLIHSRHVAGRAD